jgi:hypothetical protein
MAVGPDGCVYVAEFAGFWKAAEGANVSRYCGVRDGADAAARPSSGAATGGTR